MNKLGIGVIIGSVREGRRGETYARWIFDQLATRPEVQAELLDLRDFGIGNYDHAGMPTVVEKSYTADGPKRWSERIHALDGYIIVTPEYNHSFPGSLKNALDHVMAGWKHKPVGFVSYGGGAGGARAVEQLRLVTVEFRMVPIRDEINLRLIGMAADEAGRPTDPFYLRRAELLIENLLWWAQVTRDGREHHPAPATR